MRACVVTALAMAEKRLSSDSSDAPGLYTFIHTWYLTYRFYYCCGLTIVGVLNHNLSTPFLTPAAGKRVKTENAASLITLTPETRTLFEHCAATLTEKYDRHERLVKKSRDITIASKRTIFLLHRLVAQRTTYG